MRIVLHIGMPKTGSTQIQSTLGKNRKLLLHRGILYPENKDPIKSQTFLIAAIPLSEQNRMVRSLFESDNQLSEFFKSSAQFLNEVVKQESPRILVFSSEMLFREMNDCALRSIRDVLYGIAASVEVVCYVRNPADYYLSVMLQRTRQSSVIQPPAAVEYRSILEAYSISFPDIKVINYDRSGLVGNSIVTDFFSRLLMLDPNDLQASGFSNVSPSAEGMELIRVFRSVVRPGMNDRPDPLSARYLAHIQAAEEALNENRKARLKQELADFVVSRSLDLLWLRDTFGIAFQGLDYGKVGKNFPSPHEFNSMRDVCEFDEDYFTRLREMSLERVLLSEGSVAQIG